MWKVKVVDNYPMLTAEIYVTTEGSASGLQYMNRDGVMCGVKMGQRFEPAFVIPADIKQELLSALLESGVKPKKQSSLEGQLHATLAHLKDLQQLVKWSHDPAYRRNK